MPISIRVAGTELVTNELIGLTPKIERTVLARMSQIAFDDAQRGAGAHSKKGDLFASLYNRKIPKGREVGHDPQRAPHALFVNFGTRPHVILPKKKRALRWVVGNRFVFAKKVNHPGYRGDPYMIRAADEALRQFAAIVDTAFKDAAT